MVKYGIYNKSERKNVYFDSITDARKYAIRYSMYCSNMEWIRTTLGKSDTTTIRTVTRNKQLGRIVEEIYPHKIAGHPYWYCDKYDESNNKIVDFKEIDPKTGKTSKPDFSKSYIEMLQREYVVRLG